MDADEKPKETKQQARKRPRSAKAIGKSEEWLFTTLESIGDAVIATDAEGVIVFMNSVAVSLTGWTEEEAQGRNCSEVFHIVNEKTREETESPVTKALRDGVISGLANHTILIARDGTERSIDDSGSPIRGKTGKLDGVVLIFRDVTERRKIELALQEHQAILQTLFDHIPVIITLIDANGQLLWTNREWKRLVGWSMQEELIPYQSDIFARTTTVQQAQPPQNAPLLSDLAFDWRELNLISREGQALVLAWATVQLSDGTTIGIGQDISRHKLKEEKAEERNRHLLQAMKEADHRIKNNLQSVASLLDFYVMENPEGVPPQELTQVRMHLRTLASIHDLLVHTPQVNTSGTLSAKEELEKLLPMLQEIVGKRHIEWSVEDIQLPIKAGMSLAVLINELISNAVKHGGQRVELSLNVLEQNVTLQVCDDGPGFSGTFHPSTSASYGLELVESVGRIDLHGQTFYENRPSGGACVRVTFPLPALPSLLEAYPA
jgi:PAS domain S-box-containing protein